MRQKYSILSKLTQVFYKIFRGWALLYLRPWAALYLLKTGAIQQKLLKQYLHLKDLFKDDFELVVILEGNPNERHV